MRLTATLLSILIVCIALDARPQGPTLTRDTLLLNGNPQAAIAFVFAQRLGVFTETPMEEQSGEEKTWDFSDEEDPDADINIARTSCEAQTGYENFSGCSYATEEEVGGFISRRAFNEVVEDLNLRLGTANNSSGSEQISVCDTAPVIYQFPLYYGSGYNSDYACSPQEITTGFQEAVSGTRSVECDGYGTLILPNHTFSNCLRLRVLDEGTSTNYYDGQLLNTLIYSIVSYHWMVAGFPFPVATYEQVSYEGTKLDPSLLYLNDESVGITSNAPVQFQELQLYPNPVMNGGVLHLGNLSGSAQSIEVLDVHGRACLIDLVLDRTNLEEFQLQLPLLPTGWYILAITSDNQVHHTRFQILE